MSQSVPNSRASSPSPIRHGGARKGSGRNSRAKRSRVNNAIFAQSTALSTHQHRQHLAECISSLSNSHGRSLSSNDHTRSIRNMEYYKCICDENIIDDHSHFHTCNRLTGGGRIHKHNALVRTLGQCVKDTGIAIKYEPVDRHYINVKNNSSSTSSSLSSPTSSSLSSFTLPSSSIDTQQRADLLLISHDAVYYVDVSIIQSDAKTYVEKGADVEQKLAIKHVEKLKYDKHINICQKKKWKCIPFIYDSYGNIGDIAMKFIKEISEIAELPHEWMMSTLNRLSCTLQRSLYYVNSVALSQC